MNIIDTLAEKLSSDKSQIPELKERLTKLFCDGDVPPYGIPEKSCSVEYNEDCKTYKWTLPKNHNI